MKYKNILITGGAGFVGSNLAIKLKNKYPKSNILALDNLKRRGSELNISRLKLARVNFIYGDVRNKEDLNFKKIDLLLECSAESSVMAGINSSPEYLINTNLLGAINCFELARKHKADVIFLSTSRVYPIKKLNRLKFIEKEKVFDLAKDQKIKGASDKGVAENFPLNGIRSLYGTTKLCAELLLQEYIENYGIKAIINRCGLITGPWQMGKIDQGVVVFWLAQHIFKGTLSYIGFNGNGKQVRDFIHIDDLFKLIDVQINNMSKFNKKVYNVGGGINHRFSLKELTYFCQKISNNKIKIVSENKQRKGDIRIYISDITKVTKETGWKPKIDIEETLNDIYKWIIKNKEKLWILK